MAVAGGSGVCGPCGLNDTVSVCLSSLAHGADLTVCLFAVHMSGIKDMLYLSHHPVFPPSKQDFSE